MARVSPQSVDRVRQAADIVEIVSAHTDLRQQGARWVGLCPFHEERTPSFSVNPADKLYYCFGCEAGGDVFGFVQEKEGLEFPAAVELLAERYGVELEREQEDPRAEAARRRRDRLRELLKRTAAFYASYLWDSPEAGKARQYLESRGLGEEVLRDFGIGYAPSAWDQVLTRGQRAGFSIDELRAAGLAQKGRGGGVYDRFRERITFPVRDARGRVLGFGARAMRDEQGAKYVNSAEGELYRKSETLYGIDRARGAIAKAGQAIVVEGYTDVLALHQAGVEEAVGVMGTAITEQQVQMLSGQVGEVVLALDADRAGQEAMLRAQRKAAGRRMRIRVAAMPEGKDPAEMLGGEGAADEFRELVDSALELARVPGPIGARWRRPLLAGGAGPRAGRGGAGAGRDGGGRQPRGAGPLLSRAVGHEPGDGDRADRRGADAGRGRDAGRAGRPDPRRGDADLARAPRAGAAGDVDRRPEGRT